MDAVRVNTQFLSSSASDRGFTIVELIVALALSLVAMTAIYSSFRAQQRSYIHQERVAAMQQNLRAGMYTMEREIRMAGFDPTGLTAASITNAGGNTITFTMDADWNGVIAGAGETITYDLVGNNLRRNSQIIAEYIQSLSFNYQDLNGNGTNETVQVTVVAQTRGGVGTATSRTLSMNIRCRNIDMGI